MISGVTAAVSSSQEMCILEVDAFLPPPPPLEVIVVIKNPQGEERRLSVSARAPEPTLFEAEFENKHRQSFDVAVDTRCRSRTLCSLITLSGGLGSAIGAGLGALGGAAVVGAAAGVAVGAAGALAIAFGAPRVLDMATIMATEAVSRCLSCNTRKPETELYE